MSASTSLEFGQFHGPLVFEALDDGRLMQLVQPYSFTEPSGKVWTVPIGAKVDGASIPRVLWTFIGGPFEGKYRDASVIHDFYCDIRTEPWQAVHRVFYYGMRAAGVSQVKALYMYTGVYFRGPRWSESATDNVHLNQGLAQAPAAMTTARTASPLLQGLLQAMSFVPGSPPAESEGIGAQRLPSPDRPPVVKAALRLKCSDLEALVSKLTPSIDEIAHALDAAESHMVALHGAGNYDRVLLDE